MPCWRTGAWVGLFLFLLSTDPLAAEGCNPDVFPLFAQVCELTTNAPPVGSAWVRPGARLTASWDSVQQIHFAMSLCRFDGANTYCQPSQGGVVITPRWSLFTGTSTTVTLPATGLVLGSQYRVRVEVSNGTSSQDNYPSTDFSPPFVVSDAPYVTGVTLNPVNVQQGSAQTISWSSQYQQSYRLYLYNGAGTAPIDMRQWGGGSDGWFETGGAAARSTFWYAPSTLPPGTYRIAVLVTITNGFYSSAYSPSLTVLPTPLIGSLVLSTARPQTGAPLTITWASTNQERYAVYDCDSSGHCADTGFLSGTTQKSAVWPIPLDQPLSSGRRLRVRVWSSSGASTDAMSATYSFMRASVSFRSRDTIVDEGNTQVVPEVMVRTSDGGPTTAPITLTRSTMDGTATAPGDYTASNVSATIPIGVADDGFAPLPAVAIREDALDESGEGFSLGLSIVAAAVLDDSRPQHLTHKVIIMDDDPPPSVTIADAMVEEPDAGLVDAQFVVSLSAASGLPVSVAYSTADATAAGGADYSPRTGTLTIPAGSNSATIRVPVLPDTQPESAETFALNLSDPVNATLADTQGVATILDPVRISVADVSVAEGDAGGSPATFTVSLSRPHPQPISVAYVTANVSAGAGSDYVAASGTLTLPPGSVGEAITVTVNGDTVFETDETFQLNLSGAPGGTRLLDGQGLGTIANDDAPPPLSISDAAAIEGVSGASATASFLVSLSTPAGTPVTVTYATADATATAGSDYTARSGTLTIPAGGSTATISVPVKGDAAVEPDETFTVTLTSPDPASVPLARAQATGVIKTDDFGLLIADTAVAEGDTGAVSASFIVSLTSPAPSPVTVKYATANSTATAGSDYTTTSGTLTFAPGVTVQSLAVPVQGDTLNEADETFTVKLTAPTGGGVLVDASAVGTIGNDDAAPSLSVGDVTVVEVDPGANVNAVFTVTLSEASGQAIAVEYGTANGSAVAPLDYTAKTGVVTFAAGTTSRTIVVSVVGDSVVEGDESFFVNLSNPDPAGVVLADGQGVGTVLTDDFGLSISDLTVAEGDNGTSDAVFAVTLSSPRTSVVTVKYATANSTATAGSDYTTTSGTLTFAPGVTVQSLAVPVQGDTLNEADETFTVKLTAPTGGGVLVDASAVGTIGNDDAAPSLSVGDVTVVEVDLGANVNAVFTVTLSEASGQAIAVEYGTANGSAVAPGDYTAKTGVVTFAAGTTSRTIVVSVVGDNVVEGDESFFVNLSNPDAAGVVLADGQGVGTVLTDDFGLSIDDVTAAEGDTGTVSASFIVSLTSPAPSPVTVKYATANSTATAGSDYTTTSGTLTFAPGVTVQTLAVPVQGDTLNEADETFTVKLTAPTGGGVLVDASAVGTIGNDDAAPSLSVGDVTVMEVDPGANVNAVFTVTLSEASGQAIAVEYGTANGSAVAPGDYTAKTGAVTFAAGTTSRTIVVSVVGDNVVEGDESFFVNLSNPDAAGVVLADGQGVGTVLTDDFGLSIDDVTVAEGDSGTSDAVFAVTLSSPRTSVVTVKYATANSTATAGSDYTTTSGTLTFAPGVTVQTLAVPVLGETLNEADEAFFVNLSAPGGAVITKNRGTGTITNDDGATPLTEIATVPYRIVAPGSYVLAGDLVLSESAPAAITIEADDVTLDLRGFALSASEEPGSAQAMGILGVACRDVTVRGGVVRGFRQGVVVADPTRSRTRGMRLESLHLAENAEAGIHVQGAGSIVRGNRVTRAAAGVAPGTGSPTYGLWIEGPQSRVLDNQVEVVSDDPASPGRGIAIAHGPASIVEGNRVSGNGITDGIGIEILDSEDVVVTRNAVEDLAIGVSHERSTGRFEENAMGNVEVPETGGPGGDAREQEPGGRR